jgi:hypothetical protein
MRTRTKVMIAIGFAMMLGAVAVHGTVQAAGYRVYCAKGKIEVDSRSLEQMKRARGDDVCLLREFPTLEAAENFADSKGGKGAPCDCK